MQSQRSRCREIHTRRSRGRLRIREKRAATKVHVGRQARARREIPFQREGIQANSVRRTIPLRQQKHRNHVHGVLKSAAQRPGPDRIGKHPPVPHAQVPNSYVRRASVQPMTSAGPYL